MDIPIESFKVLTTKQLQEIREVLIYFPYEEYDLYTRKIVESKWAMLLFVGDCPVQVNQHLH